MESKRNVPLEAAEKRRARAFVQCAPQGWRPAVGEEVYVPKIPHTTANMSGTGMVRATNGRAALVEVSHVQMATWSAWVKVGLLRPVDRPPVCSYRGEAHGVPPTLREMAAGRVRVHLMAGEVAALSGCPGAATGELERALDIWRGHVEAMREREAAQATELITIDTPLAGLELDVRTINSLEERGWLYLGDLIGVDEEQLRRIPNTGSETIAQIRRALREALANKKSGHQVQPC